MIKTDIIRPKVEDRYQPPLMDMEQRALREKRIQLEKQGIRQKMTWSWIDEEKAKKECEIEKKVKEEKWAQKKIDMETKHILESMNKKVFQQNEPSFNWNRHPSANLEIEQLIPTPKLAKRNASVIA